MIATPRRQRGVALVVALLVVALALVLIAALLDRGELALARTRNQLRASQAEAYAVGLEGYAASILIAVQADAPGAPDTNASPWTRPLPPQPVPGGLIGATLRDLGGCFNLNNLSPKAGGDRTAWHPVFVRLLAALRVDPSIAEAVEHWLDAGEAGAADSNAYLARRPAYRPRGDVFAHVSELRLVRGVGADAYARLATHVCALPPGTRINVNTATAALLEAVTDATPAGAQSLWQGGTARWQDVTEFTRQVEQLHQRVLAAPALLDTHSEFFQLRGDIVLDAIPFVFFSTIEWRRRGGDAGLRVVARSRGSDDALTTAVAIDGDADAGTR